MKKPHVHAAIIKAWADGAEIQFRHEHMKEWKNTDGPSFIAAYEYRVKPEPYTRDDARRDLRRILNELDYKTATVEAATRLDNFLKV